MVVVSSSVVCLFLQASGLVLPSYVSRSVKVSTCRAHGIDPESAACFVGCHDINVLGACTVCSPSDDPYSIDLSSTGRYLSALEALIRQ